MPILPENKNNELHYLIKMGFIVEGTAGNAGKHQLTAKGLAEYDRLVEAMDSKEKVIFKLKVLANAFTDAKTLM